MSPDYTFEYLFIMSMAAVCIGTIFFIYSLSLLADEFREMGDEASHIESQEKGE